MYRTPLRYSSCGTYLVVGIIIVCPVSSAPRPSRRDPPESSLLSPSVVDAAFARSSSSRSLSLPRQAANWIRAFCRFLSKARQERRRTDRVSPRVATVNAAANGIATCGEGTPKDFLYVCIWKIYPQKTFFVTLGLKKHYS